MNKPCIAQLQSWMNEVITRQGTMQHKLQRAEHLYQLNEKDVIAETRDVSIYSRMNVYTSGYVMRLLECICADFPVLQKFMGDEVFNQFAKASLLWSPSTSYSLYDLGSTFIRFLEATRPKNLPPDDEQNIFLELPIEIAKAERARQEAIRSKGTEDRDIANAEIFPGDILFNAHQVVVETPACLRLIELKFPVKHLFEQLHSEEAYQTPEPQQSFVAISRVNYRLTMEELEEWQFLFLQACTTTTALTNAINETASATKIPASTLLAELCVWLPVFRDRGFLVFE